MVDIPEKRPTVADLFPKEGKSYAMGIMLVRGPVGFRQLDYFFCRDKINVKRIVDKCSDAGFNTIGVVIKDTDGACIWDTKIGWNPTGRDILGEFCDYGQTHGDMKVFASFTSMNDAYQGHIHPERVSVHKNGTIATHDEGEMRVELPPGKTWEELHQLIPFLTKKYQSKGSAARSSRGEGYVPQTSFMCPTSKHVDYLCDLVGEVVRKYPIGGILADYIRYDGGYTDLCQCDRCKRAFGNLFPGRRIGSGWWKNFREMTIGVYGRKFVKTVKAINPQVITGWFQLAGPKFLMTRPRLAQNWEMLSSIFDVTSPMEYPYLMGTKDDGSWWGFLGNVSFYFSRIMRKIRWHEMKNQVMVVTNSVECNAKEMLRQCRAYDTGAGVSLFKYFGTKKSQWAALKKYLHTEARHVKADPMKIHLNRWYDRTIV